MHIITIATYQRAYDALDLHVGPDPEMTNYLADLSTRRPWCARVIFAALWADAWLSDRRTP